MKFPQAGPSAAPTRRLSIRRDDSEMRRRRSRNFARESPNDAESTQVHSAPHLGKIPTASPARSLDLMSEEELLKLTLNNTKKNHGGRKGRFRSQMERVCRRLDNMAVEARLQQRLYLEALPIVEPDRATAVDAFVANGDVSTSARGSEVQSDSGNSVTESLEVDTQGEDCFAIEPATNESIFSSKSGKSLTSIGRPKSVRISTSVSFLEYSSAGNEREPLSVSTCNRFQHPTRRNKDPLVKRALTAEPMMFPRAQIKRRGRSPIRDTGDVTTDAADKDSENNRHEGNAQRIAPSAKTTSPRTSSEKSTSTTSAKPSPSPRTPKSPPTPKAAYVVPSPNGAYGPRGLPK